MPTEIVTETCLAPECNLSEKDIDQFLDEMISYIELFRPAFQRAEQSERSKAYVCGLLGDTPRKNVERMALDWGDKARSMQHFIGQSPWKTEPVTLIHQRLVAVERRSCAIRQSIGKPQAVADAVFLNIFCDRVSMDVGDLP